MNVLFSLAVGLCVSLAPTALLSQERAEELGKQEYTVACAGCHGESAMGDGPLAGLLNISTPSLLELSQANGGTFPYEAVLTTIDGRDGVRAHGSSMPIWGERFQSSATSQRGETAEMVARGRILSLIYHLQSIQK
ncbi:c-type cytochrome [Aliiruegeria sabulilitoris]|uniref:c-type cytochrome n=1 Tax=Aliiruegeria sabulilitoris TaxID=1510458 RepID=UPI000831C7A6|nr:cytochrome c [Aliiruegeria sabulilitoris]NDR57984.1 cytochrome c [Pseudoruegeria sp. M32A2M]